MAVVSEIAPAILPVYLVIDTSASMGSTDSGGRRRIDAANSFVPAVIETCEELPSVQDKLRLSLISFDNEARTVVPLGKKDDFLPIPTLEPAGGTYYASVFKLLRREIEDGVRTLRSGGAKVFRPVVFFITDGEPLDSETLRMAAFEELTNDGFRANPNIVVFGVGDATTDSVKAYVHRKGSAIVAKPDVNPADALAALIPPMVRSLVNSTTGDSSSAGFVGLDEDDIDNDKFDSWSLGEDDVYD